MAHIPFGGRTLDPAEVNPYPRPKSAALLAVEAWQAKRRWRNRFGGLESGGVTDATEHGR